MNSIRVSQLLEDREYDLRLTLVAGERGLQHRINSSRIQKPGLALTGFTEHLHPHRVQVFGNTEVSYLLTLPVERQREVLASLFQEELACVVVTKDLAPPPALVEACEKAGLALMRSPLLSSAFIQQVQAFLEEALTESSSLHGVLMDVFGVGILLLGKSGIGKSEIALDLVMRGHRLVADDIVDVTRRRQGVVYGAGNPVIRHHMEIRGLGIINIKDLFGVASVRERKKIELVIELHEWDPQQEYDRLGVEDRFMNIVGVDIPLSVVPVRPGRNMTTIIEVAARNQLLKQQGHHSAREFAERLNRAIAEGAMRRSMGEEVE
ncbi:HPr(Ser) kinase/phosphatase [Vitiosangium sp. GDMCC 1.1324]|uniref:HPr(Ser) kinase/phosphatase n=1 Tax=Vitiosangium sp. (strain GDMCC 1.1324) TaxID=2138576 RepID=UPI000D3A0A14|nr:HPr(Ser) kinase/phosphatase [Vitiosangium sp. GDMCC 1.1324]PTL81337.1 HPr kinase/phosphorylase [Vitiosangium sp. GDMCC 1.1324]